MQNILQYNTVLYYSITVKYTFITSSSLFMVYKVPVIENFTTVGYFYLLTTLRI